MYKLKNLFFVFIIGTLALVGCNKDDDDAPSTGDLTLKISGLEDLGSDYAYEGWLIVDGSPVSAGIFGVNESGELSKTSFQIDANKLKSATAYVLTIEPKPDSDPTKPSAVHILAGDFSGNSASVSIDHGSAIGNDFATATGKYILATPTDGGMTTDENSGVWWLEQPGGSPTAGLSLPTLPASGGWKYEGWAVIGTTPVTTGKFESPSGADESAPFSGTSMGPPFPGEDFLNAAPSGLTFPTDLAGMTVVISVEPEPDNSPKPFLLKPLVGMVPMTAMARSPYDMSNNASATNPTGTVTR